MDTTFVPEIPVARAEPTFDLDHHRGLVQVERLGGPGGPRRVMLQLTDGEDEPPHGYRRLFARLSPFEARVIANALLAAAGEEKGGAP